MQTTTQPAAEPVTVRQILDAMTTLSEMMERGQGLPDAVYFPIAEAHSALYTAALALLHATA